MHPVFMSSFEQKFREGTMATKAPAFLPLGEVLHVALLGEEHGIDIPFCKGRIAIQTYMHAFAL